MPAAARFSKIHVFPFSPRRGTPAAEMPEQISKQEKSERVARLSQVETDLRQRYFDQLVGKQLQLLVESVDAGQQIAVGTSCRFANVSLNSAGAATRQLVDVLISENVGDHLLGKAVH